MVACSCTPQSVLDRLRVMRVTCVVCLRQFSALLAFKTVLVGCRAVAFIVALSERNKLWPGGST